MRTRNDPGAENKLKNNSRYIDSKEKLEEILRYNTKPVYIEIGMGKGNFIIQSAYKNPDRLYIGIELSKTILSIATNKITLFENENNCLVDNLVLMSFDATDLLDYIKEKTVDRLFLNFSDPWPKKKHEKRRLTSKVFLDKYKRVLKDDALIEFKTDNRKLFEYSIVSINNNNFKFEEIYLDLHKDNVDNIMTEYEAKFCDKGPIYKLVVKAI